MYKGKLSLSIVTTGGCNMDCSFCINKEDMKISDSPKLPIAVSDFIAKHKGNIGDFTISGGEPFLDLMKLQEILNVVIPENRPVTILTNGTLLNGEIVEELNNYSNIRVGISISALRGGEKSLNKLVSLAPTGFEIVNHIKRLNNKYIVYVIQKLDDVDVLDIMALQSMFDCDIVLALDDDNLESYSTFDCRPFTRILYRLRALNLEDTVSFARLFEGTCDCRHSIKMLPDGSTTEKSHEKADSFESKGCSSTRNRMTPGLYDLFAKLYSAFKNK